LAPEQQKKYSAVYLARDGKRALKENDKFSFLKFVVRLYKAN